MRKHNTIMSTIYYRQLSYNFYFVLWGLLFTLLKNKKVCFICFTSCLLRLLSNFDVHGWSITEFADFITYILNSRELLHWITSRRTQVYICKVFNILHIYTRIEFLIHFYRIVEKCLSVCMLYIYSFSCNCLKFKDLSLGNRLRG